MQYRHLNKFKYTQILSNILKYIEMYYKCIELHWNTLPIWWSTLEIHPNALKKDSNTLVSFKIHLFIIKNTLICFNIHTYTFKYIIVPSKNLTYFWHILQYHYYTPISFHIHPYMLKLSWDLFIPHLFILSLTLFFKTVLVPHYSTKMSMACHDIFVGIQKSSIFHKFPTSYW
jgi:hypothetical protein